MVPFKGWSAQLGTRRLRSCAFLGWEKAEIRMLLEVERTSGEAVRCAGPTRMTPSRHRSVRNPAAQQSLPRCAILWSEAREGPASEPARVHIAARRRGSVAARGARAAAGDAGGRISQQLGAC